MRILHIVASIVWLLLAAASDAEILRLEIPGKSHEIPIKVYLPADAEAPSPTVLFSHGLGGSREGSAYLGEHWSDAGYVVVAIQHPGSDDSVWKGQPKWKIRRVLKQAASLKSFSDRVADVRSVLDYLDAAKGSSEHPLHGKIDTTLVGMGGHSFGAVTTQAMMGQNFIRVGDAAFSDPRIDCFILMSPSQGKRLKNSEAFGSVARPVLCMTGTEDASPLRKEVTPESRKEVFAALPDGRAYQIVFDGGEHSIFGNYRKHDPRFHAAIERITTEFLDAYLRADTEALDWLRSEDVEIILEPEDQWEWK